MFPSIQQGPIPSPNSKRAITEDKEFFCRKVSGGNAESAFCGFNHVFSRAWCWVFYSYYWVSDPQCALNGTDANTTGGDQSEPLQRSPQNGS